ncbi:MAG: efflux RND transporter periplasmic adaptor subunit [Bacteroidota bacterium]|nr:efflux RND transporter periplasmic adaptor subunit [Bacteroidota bacterium]
MKPNINLVQNVLRVIIVVALSINFSCKESNEKKVDVNESVYVVPSVTITKKQIDLLNIKIAPVTDRLIYPTLYANGIVAAMPNHEATVSTRIAGVVDKIFVVEGSVVKKGDPIMILSSSELVQLQQDYLSALVDARFYQKEYERQTTLRKENVGALSEFQLIESKYMSAVSKEKTLKEKLTIQEGVDPIDLQDPLQAIIRTHITLKAPISGFVYNMPSRIGMRAEPGMVLAEIIDLSELRADVHCYEKDMGIISENQEIEIQFINKKIPHVMGKIENISRTIDKETRSIVLHTSFKAPKGYLVIPDMSVTAKIKGENSGNIAKTVPISAIHDENDQSFIFYCHAPDTTGAVTFKKGKVKTKTNDGEFVEIEYEEMIPANVLVAINNTAGIQAELLKADQEK